MSARLKIKYDILVVAVATLLLNTILEAAEAPSIWPSEDQVKIVKSGESITFTAGAGWCDKPSSPPAITEGCEWVEDGSQTYVWSSSGLSGGNGEGTSTNVNQDQPGKGTVKVKAKQQWKADHGSATEVTYSPEASVNATVFKVEFDKIYEAVPYSGYYIMRSGESSEYATIALKVDPADTEIPQDTIIWTGGVGGSSQLEYYVSKGGEGDQKISATVAGEKIFDNAIVIIKFAVTTSAMTITDGKPVNVDIEVKPDTWKSCFSDVVMSCAKPGEDSSTYDNVNNQGSSIVSRGSNLQWKIPNVIWYSSSSEDGNGCNVYSRYQIRASANIEGIEFSNRNTTIDADTGENAYANLISVFDGAPLYTTTLKNGIYTTIATNPNNTYYRDPKADVHNPFPTSSQFHAKVQAEEEFHAEQFKTSPLLSDQALVENVFKNPIIGTGPSSGASFYAASNKVNEEADKELARFNIAISVENGKGCALEREAKQHVNYKYRFTWDCTYSSVCK